MTDDDQVEPTRKTRPLGLDAKFEIALATAMVVRPDFAIRVAATGLESGMIANETAKITIQAVLTGILKGEGPPGSLLLFLQRLRRTRVQKGDMTLAERNAIGVVLEDAQDTLPTDKELAAELKPVLLSRLRKEAVDQAAMVFASGGDPREAFNKLDAVNRLDSVVTSMRGRDTETFVFGSEANAQVIETHGMLDRIKVGVTELDDLLDGGQPRRTLFVWCGDSGAGKSHALIHQTNAASIQGVFAAYLTLELPPPLILARMQACLTGIPTNAIIAAPRNPVILEAIERAESGPGYVRPIIGKREGSKTDPTAVFEWVDAQEQIHGRKVDLLVVDYADKMVAHVPIGASSKSHKPSSYVEQGDVYEQFFNFAKEGGRWVATASQTTRRPDGGLKKKTLTQHSAADSMNKVRTSDIWVTINPKENGLLALRADKFRQGISERSTSDLPFDFAVSRIGPFDMAESFMAKCPKRRKRVE